MAPGGWLYTITDVPELGEWMVSGDRMGLGASGWGFHYLCALLGCYLSARKAFVLTCVTLSRGRLCVFFGVNCVLTRGVKHV